MSNLTIDEARKSGRTILVQGFANPRNGTVRTAHVENAYGHTLCNRLLSEPRRLTGHLDQYTLCKRCAAHLSKGEDCMPVPIERNVLRELITAGRVTYQWGKQHGPATADWRHFERLLRAIKKAEKVLDQ